MSRKKSYLTVTDQFCGAGGSSQGAVNAGAEVSLALNHWSLAIETHNTNFPDTRHDCTDISACDPRRYPSTDILITSPECTNHSLAKGKKIVKAQLDLFNSGKVDPAAERSRATMWDVCRFAEYHKYNYIIVENVVDARKWVMFDAWLMAMHSLGYNHKCVYHNSMHSWPTPQSRDRMYVHFWRKGNKAPDLNYTPLAPCNKCLQNVNAIQTWKKTGFEFGKYRTQYVYCCPQCATVVEPYYYAAFNIIDWSDKGTRIGDRKNPLAPATIARIKYAKKKYSGQGVVINDQHSTGIDCRVKSLHEFIGSVTTQPHFKIALPFIIKLEHSQRDSNVSSIGDPLNTQNTRQSSMLINNVRSIVEAMQTQTTTQGMALAIPPYIIENKKTSTGRDVFQPLSCATSVGYHGLLTNESWNAFISQYYGGSFCANHITDAVGSVTTKHRAALTISESEDINDYYYRMLKAPEVKLAMAFAPDYKILGNSRDQVKQCGNAVTPPAMEWQVKRAINTFN